MEWCVKAQGKTWNDTDRPWDSAMPGSVFKTISHSTRLSDHTWHSQCRTQSTTQHSESYHYLRNISEKGSIKLRHTYFIQCLVQVFKKGATTISLYPYLKTKIYKVNHHNIKKAFLSIDFYTNSFIIMRKLVKPS